MSGKYDEYQQRYYDQQPDVEWGRLERHRTEFAVTLRALADHLPPPPARVLDCGGGPGRYAIELSRQGYDVTLFDLSSKNLEFARRQAEKAGVIISAYEHGSAVDLSRFADASFDAVLLMGPLYHLLEEEERLQALVESYRVLKPGGPVFAAFVGRYAAHLDLGPPEPTWPIEYAHIAETILRTGRLPPRDDASADFAGYLAHPSEVTPLCRRAGFEVVTVLGVEGLVATFEEQINDFADGAWETWVDLNYRVAHDPSLHGCAGHLLAAAIKPRWRAVLHEIARRLNEADVKYKIVGGASAALHGVDGVSAEDLDIETDVEGAYRFQELFAENTVEPVALRESETYRSQFGRFKFGGVKVEVMGDLCRREGDEWVPTAATTETRVELDGVEVQVSWLEEETLAYIRRGRLDRAAACLLHCDHRRLLALLRGERATNVL